MKINWSAEKTICISTSKLKSFAIREFIANKYNQTFLSITFQGFNELAI